jgi:hypothetical protein
VGMLNWFVELNVVVAIVRKECPFRKALFTVQSFLTVLWLTQVHRD